MQNKILIKESFELILAQTTRGDLTTVKDAKSDPECTTLGQPQSTAPKYPGEHHEYRSVANSAERIPKMPSNTNVEGFFNSFRSHEIQGFLSVCGGQFATRRAEQWSRGSWEGGGGGGGRTGEDQGGGSAHEAEERSHGIAGVGLEEFTVHIYLYERPAKGGAKIVRKKMI